MGFKSALNAQANYIKTWPNTHDALLLVLCFLPLAWTCGLRRTFLGSVGILATLLGGFRSLCPALSASSLLIALHHYNLLPWTSKTLPDFIIVLLRKSWPTPVARRTPAHSTGLYSNSAASLVSSQNTWLGSSQTFLPKGPWEQKKTVRYSWTSIQRRPLRGPLWQMAYLRIMPTSPLAL